MICHVACDTKIILMIYSAKKVNRFAFVFLQLSMVMFVQAQDIRKGDLKTAVSERVNQAATVQRNSSLKQEAKTSVSLENMNGSLLKEGELSLVNLRLPGNKTAKDYYVKKYGNKLYLNGDIIVHDFGLVKTFSYTKNDETHTFGKDDLYRWPGGVVPVVLESSVFTSDSYLTIKQALDYFNFNTGLIFKERGNEEDYLVIKCVDDDGSGKGGASAVGRQRNGSNVLELTKGKFSVGTILHELMHALGVYHEQARTDRDNYVEIKWDNVRESAKNNFQIEGDGTARSGYDYCSIMQYNTTAFAKNPAQPTIVCKSNGAVVACPACIGNRVGLTKMDLEGLDKLYAGIGISRFPCNVPFVSSKVPIAGCIGVSDNLIKAKWNYYRNVLGDCLSGVVSMRVFNTTYVEFEYGQVYHSPHGVFAVYGSIYQFFKTHNGLGTFGFPLSDEMAIDDREKQPLNSWNRSGYTRVSKFEKAVILWGPGTGSKQVTAEKFAEGPAPLESKTMRLVEPRRIGTIGQQRTALKKDKP